MSAPELREVDRFLVPEGSAFARYFLNRLFVTHGRRERWRGHLARLTGALGLLPGGRRWRLDSTSGEPRPRDGGNGGRWAPAGRLLRELVLWPDDSHAGEAARAARTGHTLLLRDYDDGRRAGVLLFPFPPGGSRPSAVVKARSEADAGPLARERDALEQVRAALPPALATTVPGVMEYRVRDGVAALVLSHVPGRSAYVELRNGVRPGRRVGAHFEAAAHWLAAFHQATRSEHVLTLDSGDPALAGARDWLPDIQRRLAERPVRNVMSHGDFWARNLLVRPSRAGGGDHAPAVSVVDWEDAAAEAPPTEDLFHFAISYGRAFPWRGYAPPSIPAAFRATFLDDTPVSRAVARYLRLYRSLTDLDPDLLAPLLRIHLLHRCTRAEAEDMSAEANAWRRCEAELAAAPPREW